MSRNVHFNIFKIFSGHHKCQYFVPNTAFSVSFVVFLIYEYFYIFYFPDEWYSLSNLKYL